MTNPERRDIIEQMQRLADEHTRQTRHACHVTSEAPGNAFVSCTQCDYRLNEVELAEIGAKGG